MDQSEPLRVLVVDDDPDCALSTARLVRLYGHEAEVVQDGASAVESACLRPPDVVLLDIGLPDMTGHELARRLQELLADRPPLLVALIGDDGDPARLASRRAGIHLHLVKPADPVVLERLLARVKLLVASGAV